MSFYTSLTGLNSATAQLAVTANNIANVGTSGFKRSRADFGDIFSTSPLQKSSAQIGQGVSLKQVSQEFSQGNISTSGNSLDLAITGDGFFPLKSPDGLQDIYTRNGSFTLNDQNNVVNSTGQRLMAASVDSSGKADLSNLSALTIPPKTAGEAKETSNIQLGLNLPADSQVITAEFDRSNPATFNKSTALTVYDSGGNGYLATVYYVKTQNATQLSPQSKWQTYFYVGDTLVKPSLLQAENNFGEQLFVNKYGDVLPGSDPQVIKGSGTLEMYSLDEQSNVKQSTAAAVTGLAFDSEALGDATAAGTAASGVGSITMSIIQGEKVYAVTYNMSTADRYPEALAKNIENTINDKLIAKGESARVQVTYDPGDPDAETPVDPSFVIVNKTGTGTDVTVSKINDEDPADTDLSLSLIDLEEATFASTSLLTFDINVDEMGSDLTIEYQLLEEDSDPEILARNLEIFINNELGKSSNPDPRYGISVSYDTEATMFTFESGTTGDNSSIVIGMADTNAQAILGLPVPIDEQDVAEGEDPDTYELRVDSVLNNAVRGKASYPAILVGDVITQNITEVRVQSTNKDFFVTVGNISGNVELATGVRPSMEKFAADLEEGINSLIDTTTGLKVNGVKVSWDATSKRLTFTTGETGDTVSLQISGSADWGLANTEMAYGSNSDWIQLQQFVENGVPQYVKAGVQTEDGTDIASGTKWWPVYLDRGELSFNLTGKPLSPLVPMQFETAFLDGGKGALTMAIDFTQSTQYSSAFAVLSQSQDGAPEGELMGLNIGVDGLVSATYSNGSQNSLGKIVLANFSSPGGLRQIGDASYLASATSGIAKIGEAGSAGFGSIRAGATERSNVDLTQELVDLITAQRNFQANAKAIETSSTMTQAIVNIRA